MMLETHELNERYLREGRELLESLKKRGLDYKNVHVASDGWMDGVKVIHFAAYSPITGAVETFKYDGHGGWMMRSSSGAWIRGEKDLEAAISKEPTLTKMSEHEWSIGEDGRDTIIVFRVENVFRAENIVDIEQVRDMAEEAFTRSCGCSHDCCGHMFVNAWTHQLTELRENVYAVPVAYRINC